MPDWPIFGLLIGLAVFAGSLIAQETVRSGVVHAVAVALTIVSAITMALVIALNWVAITELNWLGLVVFVVVLLVALVAIWWATAKLRD